MKHLKINPLILPNCQFPGIALRCSPLKSLKYSNIKPLLFYPALAPASRVSKCTPVVYLVNTAPGVNASDIIGFMMFFSCCFTSWMLKKDANRLAYLGQHRCFARLDAIRTK